MVPVKKTVKTTKKAAKPAKGDSYMCGECGLTVIIDADCGCEDKCDIVCCGEPMEKKAKAKTAR
jgi:hypothetical protein